jgi:hypothetical protein
VPNGGTCGSPRRGIWRDFSDSQLFESNRAIIGRLVPDQPPFTKGEATAMSLLTTTESPGIGPRDPVRMVATAKRRGAAGLVVAGMDSGFYTSDVAPRPAVGDL